MLKIFKGNVINVVYLSIRALFWGRRKICRDHRKAACERISRMI